VPEEEEELFFLSSSLKSKTQVQNLHYSSVVFSASSTLGNSSRDLRLEEQHNCLQAMVVLLIIIYFQANKLLADDSWMLL